jgi:hypothetical protein
MMYTLKPWPTVDGDFLLDSALGENLPWNPPESEKIVPDNFLDMIDFEDWTTDEDLDPEVTICLLEGRKWDALKKMAEYFGGKLEDFIIKH